MATFLALNKASFVSFDELRIMVVFIVSQFIQLHFKFTLSMVLVVLEASLVDCSVFIFNCTFISIGNEFFWIKTLAFDININIAIVRDSSKDVSNCCVLIQLYLI